MLLYFAYASNMDVAAMLVRCPRSRPLGLARLDGHRWFIMRQGYASIREHADGEVQGLLWDLDPADQPGLDEYEEVDSGLYRKATLKVAYAGGAVDALVYVGCTLEEGVPQPGYMEAVCLAAEAAGLPATYREALMARRRT